MEFYNNSDDSAYNDLYEDIKVNVTIIYVTKCMLQS